MPVFVLLALSIRRFSDVDVGVFVLVWFLAVPVGFFLWIFGWLNYGGGEGQISESVGATAAMGWCAWHRGIFLAWVKSRPVRGYSLCAASLLSMATVRHVIGSGTSPITLAMIGVVTGFAILVTPLLLRRSIRTGRSLIHSYVAPVWKFLNRPIGLTRV